MEFIHLVYDIKHGGKYLQISSKIQKLIKKSHLEDA